MFLVFTGVDRGIPHSERHPLVADNYLIMGKKSAADQVRERSATGKRLLGREVTLGRVLDEQDPPVHPDSFHNGGALRLKDGILCHSLIVEEATGGHHLREPTAGTADAGKRRLPHAREDRAQACIQACVAQVRALELALNPLAHNPCSPPMQAPPLSGAQSTLRKSFPSGRSQIRLRGCRAIAARVVQRAAAISSRTARRPSTPKVLPKRNLG